MTAEYFRFSSEQQIVSYPSHKQSEFLRLKIKGAKCLNSNKAVTYKRYINGRGIVYMASVYAGSKFAVTCILS